MNCLNLHLCHQSDRAWTHHMIFEGLVTWQVITLEMLGLGVVERREPKGDPPSAMLLCKRKTGSHIFTLSHNC